MLIRQKATSGIVVVAKVILVVVVVVIVDEDISHNVPKSDLC